jgi:protein-S-isoprenylcysteine O-methyltransferase Ste14
VQLNLELAKLEGKQKATAVGIAGGLAALAVLLIVYAIGFAFAAIAAGLSETLSLWLSLLIVAGLLVLVAAIAGYLAMRYIRKATPPKPAQAIEEADRTLETLKAHV